MGLERQGLRRSEYTTTEKKTTRPIPMKFQLGKKKELTKITYPRAIALVTRG